MCPTYKWKETSACASVSAPEIWSHGFTLGSSMPDEVAGSLSRRSKRIRARSVMSPRLIPLFRRELESHHTILDYRKKYLDGSFLGVLTLSG